MYLSIKLISSMGNSSNPSGTSCGESNSLTSSSLPWSPFTRLSFSKMSFCEMALFTLEGGAVKPVPVSIVSAMVPFCSVLARLLERGLDRGDSRRVKECDL